MKQTVKTFMFAIALTMASTATFAQNNSEKGNRPSPEAMMEQRANSIAKQMGLDAKTTKKFVSVFKSEQNDMREVLPKRGGMPPKGERPQGNPPQGNPPSGERPQGNPPSMNGKDGKGMGSPQMSNEEKQKMAKIKEKYNKKYAKFFSQDQIKQMYKLQEQERSNHQPKGKKN